MKVENKFRRGASGAMAVFLAAGLLAGCGGQGGQDSGGSGGSGGTGGSGGGTETPEYVYVSEYIPIQGKLDNGINIMSYADGKLYASAYEAVDAEEQEVYDDQGNPVLDPETGAAMTETMDIYGQVLYTLGLDGSLERLPYTPAPAAEDGEISTYTNMNGLAVGEDGTMYVLESVSKNWNDAPPEVEQYSDEYWNYQHYTQSYTIKTFSPQGELVNEVPLDMLGPEDEEEYFYLNGFERDDSGRLFLCGEQSVYILDPDGALTATVEVDNWIERLVKIGGDIYGAYYEDGKGEVIARLDPAAGAFVDGTPLRGELYSMTAGGGDYDLYYTNGINFYGYKLDTGESEKLLNWLSCDVNPDNGGGAFVLDDGRIVSVLNEGKEVRDEETGENRYVVNSQLVVLSQKPSSQVPQKEIITLATQNLGWNMRSAIIDFNRSNDRFRVEVRDYSEYNNYDSEDEADWSAGLTKLKTEILSGNVPDILDTTGLPMKQLANKGYLEDLYPWLDSDAKLGREDLIPSLLRALEINGALYQTCDGFAIQTVVGARSVVGDKPGWNLAQYRSALASMPEGCQPFDRYTTRDTMLSTCLNLDGASFVDWGTGACSFDSEEFVELLEFVNTFPVEFDFENYEWSEDDEPAARIARGEQMLYTDYLSYLDDLTMVEAIFGGEPVFIGYPTASGTGNMFNVDNGSSFAMSSKSANKEAAWEFLRQFFTEEYQTANTWCLPSNVKAFEKKLHEAMTPQYMTDGNGNPILDENGNKVEVDYGSWSSGGLTVEYHPMTQAMADQVWELVNTTTKTASYDEEIYNIVAEGAAPFFDGQRSAQEVAKQIQSKATLYVNEQR